MGMGRLWAIIEVVKTAHERPLGTALSPFAMYKPQSVSTGFTWPKVVKTNAPLRAYDTNKEIEPIGSVIGQVQQKGRAVWCWFNGD